MTAADFKPGQRVELLRWVTKKQGATRGGYLKRTGRVGTVIAAHEPTRRGKQCICIDWDDGRIFRKNRRYAVEELRPLTVVDTLGGLA